MPWDQRMPWAQTPWIQPLPLERWLFGLKRCWVPRSLNDMNSVWNTWRTMTLHVETALEMSSTMIQNVFLIVSFFLVNLWWEAPSCFCELRLRSLRSSWRWTAGRSDQQAWCKQFQEICEEIWDVSDKASSCIFEWWPGLVPRCQSLHLGWIS